MSTDLNKFLFNEDSSFLKNDYFFKGRSLYFLKVNVQTHHSFLATKLSKNFVFDITFLFQIIEFLRKRIVWLMLQLLCANVFKMNQCMFVFFCIDER